MDVGRHVSLASTYQDLQLNTNVLSCCIRKTSSAELSEAINSMYRWYKNSEICYAYLADVPDDDNVHEEDSEFSKSRWYTRGWTLQELLAPIQVDFYSAGWQYLGTKDQMASTISRIAGISVTALTNADMIFTYSVAQRMSWASQRETTRLEDTAYCLMGLFDVNMPLLYGEGEKAFNRLQEEIMKISSDHSLFAWRLNNHSSQTGLGLLAPSPSEFSFSSQIAQAGKEYNAPWFYRPISTNIVTNRGIQIEIQSQLQLNGPYCVVLLACKQIAGSSENGVGIILRLEDDIYHRVFHQCLLSVPLSSHFTKVYKQPGFQIPKLQSMTQIHVLRAPPTPLLTSGPCCLIFLEKADLSFYRDLHGSGPQMQRQSYVVDAIDPQQDTQGCLLVNFSAPRSQFLGAILLRKTGDNAVPLRVRYHRFEKHTHITVFVLQSIHKQPWCHFVAHTRKKDKRAIFSKDMGSKHYLTPQFALYDRGSLLCPELEVAPNIKLTAEIVEENSCFVGHEAQTDAWGRFWLRDGVKVFRVVLKIRDEREVNVNVH
jgi:hypothetical protein